MRAAALFAAGISLTAAPAFAAGGDAALKICVALYRAEAATRSGTGQQDLLNRASVMEKAAKGLGSPLLSDLPKRPEPSLPKDLKDCALIFGNVP